MVDHDRAEALGFESTFQAHQLLIDLPRCVLLKKLLTEGRARWVIPMNSAHRVPLGHSPAVPFTHSDRLRTFGEALRTHAPEVRNRPPTDHAVFRDNGQLIAWPNVSGLDPVDLALSPDEERVLRRRRLAPLQVGVRPCLKEQVDHGPGVLMPEKLRDGPVAILMSQDPVADLNPLDPHLAVFSHDQGTGCKTTAVAWLIGVTSIGETLGV